LDTTIAVICASSTSGSQVTISKFFSSFCPLILIYTSLTYIFYTRDLLGVCANLLTLNCPFNTEFLLVGLNFTSNNFSNSILNTCHSVCNLGFTFGEYFSFTEQIDAL